MTQSDEPKKGWFKRLADGLTRSTRQMTEQVVAAIVKRPLDQAMLTFEQITVAAALKQPLQMWALLPRELAR